MKWYEAQLHGFGVTKQINRDVIMCLLSRSVVHYACVWMPLGLCVHVGVRTQCACEIVDRCGQGISHPFESSKALIDFPLMEVQASNWEKISLLLWHAVSIVISGGTCSPNTRRRASCFHSAAGRERSQKFCFQVWRSSQGQRSHEDSLTWSQTIISHHLWVCSL